MHWQQKNCYPYRQYQPYSDYSVIWLTNLTIIVCWTNLSAERMEINITYVHTFPHTMTATYIFNFRNWSAVSILTKWKCHIILNTCVVLFPSDVTTRTCAIVKRSWSNKSSHVTAFVVNSFVFTEIIINNCNKFILLK